MQDCSNPNALAMELLLSCITPMISNLLPKGTFMQNRAIENKTEIRKWKCVMVKNM